MRFRWHLRFVPGGLVLSYDLNKDMSYGPIAAFPVIARNWPSWVKRLFTPYMLWWAFKAIRRYCKRSCSPRVPIRLFI